MKVGRITRKKKKSNNLLFLVAVGCSIVLVICIILAVTSSGNNSVNEIVSFQLRGSETMSLYVGEGYREPGYIASGSVSGDLNNYVTVDGKVNTGSEGTYDVEYKLSYNGAVLYKTRTINVIKKPNNHSSITQDSISGGSSSGSGDSSVSADTSERIKIKMIGYSNIYLLKGTTYTDEGCKAVTNGGVDVSDKIVTTGNVDVNTPGNYKISYTITDSLGSSATIERNVEVLDMYVSSTISEKSATNKSVVLKINSVVDKFSHIILPDGKKVNDSNIEYVISKNGTYAFKVYNTYGLMRQYNYNISNIDKEAPNGSCSGYTTGRKSYITINSKDNTGVLKYVINGIGYSSNNITLNSVVNNPQITIYDMVGNTKTITCSLENRYSYVSSDPSFKLSYKYVNDGNNIPYALFSPSSASGNQDGTPVVLWLHGSGEVGKGESAFKSSGLLKVLNEWKLDGINAYVVCPQLTGKYSGSWNNTKSWNAVNKLLDQLGKELNFDTSKISVVGHSLGGIGAQYFGYHGRDKFSAMVVLSGYGTGLDLSQLKNMPTLGFVGTTGAGEDSASYNYMVGTFKKYFGEENTIVINASHGGLPKKAFTDDSNKDNKSDLFEWMLAQEK